jgi:hypothetical protein
MGKPKKTLSDIRKPLWRVIGFFLLMVLSGCWFKSEPPKDWHDRNIVYKSLASDTGVAGYYVSFADRKFLTFGQFIAAVDGDSQWREEDKEVWVITLQKFDTDLADNGPVDMYFKKEGSPSGNVNVLLFKVVTRDYEIPWVLLDQIVMKAGEKTVNAL